VRITFDMSKPFASALDPMLVNKSRNVLVAFCGHATLSPGVFVCLAAACRPIPPVYFVKGIASL
jgi:hypothetical protein